MTAASVQVSERESAVRGHRERARQTRAREFVPGDQELMIVCWMKGRPMRENS